ncbi:uncharacterized protein FA14DRAFT_171117 [Meira miltonrushii]|uniref:Uncharacterized protein n=1 Tax=Meira miltonrushii TaxID=1280837 RepID=A0A316VM81_9BASI|nr:uncharacterized protein FA14DRAFT_171117 [Meira miltonrushii]PWN38420.1 hypothetical protein FA14DRAFT_171117 [Meira miltonrushii]
MASGSSGSFFGAAQNVGGFGSSPMRSGLNTGGGGSSFSTGQQQQQSSPLSANNPNKQDMSSSTFSFGGSPQQPITSFRQPEQSGTPRQSSFRNLRRSTSGGNPISAAFGQGSHLDTTTPKSVRWEDAPEFPMQQYQQPTNQGFGSSTSYSQSLSNSFGQQQRSSTFGASRSPYQLSNSTTNIYPNIYPSQPPMQPQQNKPAEQNQFAAFAPQSSLAVTQTNNTPAKSAFNSSLASLSRPLSVSTTPARATVSKAASIVKQATTTQTPLPNPSQNAHPPKEAVITPRSAIVNRIKWNLAALLLNWFLPRIHPITTSYWLLLSATLNVFGGDSDVQLASALSWLRNACFVVLLANLAEAFIRLQTYQDTPASSASGPGSGTTIGQTARRPSLANPPNRIVSSSSPNNAAPTNTSLSNARNTPRQYAQGSPLRDSILRASASANAFEGTSSPLGEGFRGPSNSPRLQSGRKSSSSPAAAYLARRQDRLVSGSGLADNSFTGMGEYDDSADFSHDSIEVNRAIRALSASYQRELSQSLSNETGSGRGSVAV